MVAEKAVIEVAFHGFIKGNLLDAGVTELEVSINVHNRSTVATVGCNLGTNIRYLLGSERAKQLVHFAGRYFGNIFPSYHGIDVVNRPPDETARQLHSVPQTELCLNINPQRNGQYSMCC